MMRAQRFGRDERGVSAVEYAILVALISVVVIPALIMGGGSLSGIMANVAGHVAGTPAVVEQHYGPWDGCTDEQMAQVAQDEYAAAGLTPPDNQEGYAPYVDWNTCTVLLEIPSAPWAGCTQAMMDQVVTGKIDEYTTNLRLRRSAYSWERPEGYMNSSWYLVPYSDEQVEAEAEAAAAALRAASTNGHTGFALGAVIHGLDEQVETGTADVDWEHCDARLEGSG